MSRLRWFIFNGLTLLSLLLSAGVCVLNVRSYTTEEEIRDAGGSGIWDFSAAEGVVRFYKDRVVEPAHYEEDKVLNPFGLRHESNSPPGRYFDPLEGEVLKGFDLHCGHLRIAFHDGSAETWPKKVFILTSPCWLIVLILLIPVIHRVRTVLRLKRRRRLHLCLHCGYDLRATTGLCPECGRAKAADE